MNDKEFKSLMDIMSEQEWHDYCLHKLDIIMEENKDIFKRLKNL